MNTSIARGASTQKSTQNKTASPAKGGAKNQQSAKKATVARSAASIQGKGTARTKTRAVQNIPQEPQLIQLVQPGGHDGPLYRYSDEELREFRGLINSRLESARKELAYLQGLITRQNEEGTEDSENRYCKPEDSGEAMEREQLAQLASRQVQFISCLEKALIRIENKTYGICRVTGELIDKARLRAVPHATLSIEAKKMMSSN